MRLRMRTNAQLVDELGRCENCGQLVDEESLELICEDECGEILLCEDCREGD